jgi:hypothetical protein
MEQNQNSKALFGHAQRTGLESLSKKKKESQFFSSSSLRNKISVPSAKKKIKKKVRKLVHVVEGFIIMVLLKF